VAQVNHEVTGLLMRKKEQEVLEDITITPRGIPIREHTKSQFEKFATTTCDEGNLSSHN
jgi:hypothetical protein